MNTPAIGLAIAMVPCLAGCGNDAPEPATLSYRALYQVARLGKDASAGLTNQQVAFKVSSKNPAVKLADISIYIDAKSRRIPLYISTNGMMLLPVSDELAAENPRLVANQPKGSLTLDATVVGTAAFAGSRRCWHPDGMIRYSALFFTEELKQQVAAIPEITREPGMRRSLARPTIARLQATTNRESAEVSILAGSGHIRLTPTAPGLFVLRFDPDLMKQDPWVKVSTDQDWSWNTEMEEDAEQRRP